MIDKLARTFLLLWLAGFALYACGMQRASAQVCNSPSGFLQSFGPITVGDFLVLGPDCGHVIDGGLIGHITGTPSNGFVPIASNSTAAWGNPGTIPTNAFPGSVSSAIDAACASFGGQPGVIDIPAAITTFGWTVTGFPVNCAVIDYRQNAGYTPNIIPGYSAGELNGFMFYKEFGGTPLFYGQENVGTMEIVTFADSGGQNNDNGPKTNWAALSTVMYSRTVGQTSAFAGNTTHFSDGDTNGMEFIAYTLGKNNAKGDEGTQGVIGAVQRLAVVMTGAVTGLNGNNVSFGVSTAAGNTAPCAGVSTVLCYGYTLGENRPLLITTPAKIYSSGNVTAPGTVCPCTITGDGTGGQDWAAAFGTGAHTDLFLVVAWMTTASTPCAYMLGNCEVVLPITSVTDSTHLVIEYKYQGNNQALPPIQGGSYPQAYLIYKGSFVTAVAPNPNTTGSVTVANVADFAVGDTIKQVQGYISRFNPGRFLCTAGLIGDVCEGVTITNAAPATVPGLEAFGVTGNWGTALQTSGGTIVNGLMMSTLPTQAFVLNGDGASASTATVQMLGSLNAARNAYQYLGYDQIANEWYTTTSMEINGGLTLTAAAPTVGAGEIGYGATAVANTNCGTLAGSAGCIVVNVAGTTHYVPYY